MGYTHYFTRKDAVLDPKIFKLFVADCKQVCLKTEIPIASWSGKGKPQFTSTKVSFNGVEKCEHSQRNLGITWPSKSPTRGGMDTRNIPTEQSYMGAYLATRTCDGDCSHESFIVEQSYTYQEWEKPSKEEIFAFCKTAYKPYDILVTACLIILTHYFPDIVRVSSDGESLDWEDGRKVCQHVLGYGADFVLAAE